MFGATASTSGTGMRTHGPIACLLALGVWATTAHAEHLTITELPSVENIGAPRPHEIAFAELRTDEATNPTGLVPFEEWAKAWPAQKQFLSPYPDYTEPTVNVVSDGLSKPAIEKLQMYVAEARFAVSKTPQSIDLAGYATIRFLEGLDPAIEHRLMTPAEADNTASKDPDRQWCEAKAEVACVRSTYRLEGKLPMAVHLVNQLTDNTKLDDYLEFQSELRVVAPSELDQAGLTKLTGFDGPVVGAIEQTIFHVNQLMQFGKFLAVLQQNDADPNQTVVTAFIALALKERLFESSKKYENVPVLRNLVPGMVLAGKSSFNSGRSISAGLPLFARNNVKAVAAILNATDSSCPNCSLPEDGLPPVSILWVDAPSQRSLSELLPSDLNLLGFNLPQRRRPERPPWAPVRTFERSDLILQPCGKDCVRDDSIYLRTGRQTFPAMSR